MESDLLEVELDPHVDGADDVLQLGDDVVVRGLVHGRRHRSRRRHGSVNWTGAGSDTVWQSAGETRSCGGGAQEVLGRPVVAPQHVVGRHGRGRVARVLGSEASEAVEVVLLPLVLRLLGRGRDHLVLLHGMVRGPDTRNVETWRR